MQGVASALRNGFNQLRDYFQRAHRGNVLVINVNDKQYDPSRLGCKVIVGGWLPNTPPPLDRLVGVCTAIHTFLLQNTDGVVAVHCSVRCIHSEI